jgi:hypothetical protein
VLGLHTGPVDTDMMAHLDIDKTDPATVVAAALDGIEAGASEVLADAIATQVKASLGLDPSERYAALVGPQA